MFCPLTVVIWLASIHITYLAAEPNCVPDFMGEPKYEACRNLLFGDGNPASLDRYGIAAIDEKRHAFTIAGAQREQESDTEWALRIRLPKFWKNCRDPRDHPPKFRHGRGLITRDTGEWLPMAEKGEDVNRYCVRERNMGGLEEVGSTNRLLLLLYEPGSDQDNEIEAELRETGMATVQDTRAIDFRSAWGSSIAGDAESEASMEDVFADILNIGDHEPHARVRAGGVGASASSHVGAADPHIRNLGNGWVLDYASVKSLYPVDRSAAGLRIFYDHVIDLASDRIAKGMPAAKTHEFHSDRLTLKLKSTGTVPWEWVIGFARAMSHAANANWPVLFQAKANSRYWDRAFITAALNAR